MEIHLLKLTVNEIHLRDFNSSAPGQTCSYCFTSLSSSPNQSHPPNKKSLRSSVVRQVGVHLHGRNSRRPAQPRGGVTGRGLDTRPQSCHRFREGSSEVPRVQTRPGPLQSLLPLRPWLGDLSFKHLSLQRPLLLARPHSGPWDSAQPHGYVSSHSLCSSHMGLLAVPPTQQARCYLRTFACATSLARNVVPPDSHAALSSPPSGLASSAGSALTPGPHHHPHPQPHSCSALLLLCVYLGHVSPPYLLVCSLGSVSATRTAAPGEGDGAHLCPWFLEQHLAHCRCLVPVCRVRE